MTKSSRDKDENTLPSKGRQNRTHKGMDLNTGLLSELKAAPAGLHQRLTHSLANLVINSTTDLMWCVDPVSFGLLTYNQSLYDYFLNERKMRISTGMRPEDLFTSAVHIQAWQDIYRKALSQGSFTQDYLVSTGSRFLQLSVNLVRDKGNIIGISVFGKDETERKKVQDTLLENEEKFRRAFMTGLDAFYIATLEEGLILEVNPVFQDVFGYPREEVIGRTSLELNLYAHPEDRANIVGMLKKHGSVRNLEVAGRKKDGSIILVSLSISVMELKGKTHILGVLRDITAEKRTRQELLEAGEKYREIVEGAIEGIYRVTPEGKTTLSANAACAKLLGYDSENEVKASVTDWGKQVWADSSERLRFVELLRAQKEIRGYECQFKRNDGTLFWVSLNAREIISENGHVQCNEGFIQDITDRRLAAEAAERIRVGFEKASVAQALTSIGGKFIRVNEALSKMLGYAPADLEGKHFNDVTYPDDRTKGSDMLQVLLADGGTARFEKRYQNKNGRIVWVDVNIALVKNQNGKPQYFIGTFVDITERREVEEERRKIAERLETTLESTALALSMAIEIRDPYTAGHQRRVADLACRIWTKLGESSDSCEGLRIAALLHDIGKLGTPTDILTKPTQLSKAEKALIREHPATGWDTLRLVEFPWPVASIVRQHHERLDGSGYPDGLKGNEILKEASIIAVADVVEAMASHRPFRPSLGLDAALEEITAGSGTIYHPEAVKACLALFKEEGYSLPI